MVDMDEGVVRIVVGQDLHFGRWSLEAGVVTVENARLGALRQPKMADLCATRQAERMLTELAEMALQAA
jgi:hypothetical protein